MKANLSTVTVNDTEIRIVSAESQTVFLDVLNVVPIDLADFNNRVKRLARECKENKIKFFRAGAKTVNEIFPDYLESVRKYQTLYEELKEIANQIAAEGISIPCVNDENLKRAYKINEGMTQMLWRSGRISKVGEINFNLNYFLEKNLAGYEKIHL
jgi:hypothetical protein